MASCNYRVLNDIYNTIESQLTAISQNIEGLELSIDINELDIDLDNLETQLEISNKLKFLELVGIDIMTEEEQTLVYQDIMTQLFNSVGGYTAPMAEEEGD